MRWLSLLLLLAPSSALAQPVFVEHAILHVGDHEVGWLRSGTATITGAQADHVALHFEDEIISLDAEVDVSDEYSRLLASPAQVVTLEHAGPFRIDMLPRTFAQVRGRDGDGRLRVGLPEALPMRLATMPLRSPALPTTAPSDPEAPEGSWDFICSPTRIYASPSHASAIWTVSGPATRAQLGAEVDGFRPVRVWIDGYLVHGYLDHPLPTDIFCGSGRFRSRCRGGGSSAHTRIVLPPGTALFSSALASERFATLRIPYVATMADAGAIPDAPTTWLIERDEEGHPRWALEVSLRVSPDVLRAYPIAPSAPPSP